MKFGIIAIAAVFTLAACQTTPIYLRNNATGQTVQCGPHFTGLSGGDFKLEGIAMREKQCIDDYKEQGFVRVPGPG